MTYSAGLKSVFNQKAVKKIFYARLICIIAESRDEDLGWSELIET